MTRSSSASNAEGDQFMPSPPTSDLPRPKSWDEFEDIVADVLKRVWKDPYITRNGRAGQKQHGVDIFGQPEHLGGASSGRYAAAQCKETDCLTLEIVEDEANKARAFKPPLTEYLMATTAPRDAALQERMRTSTWPFRIVVWFWEDISLELSGHDDLLQKHFPGWMRKTTTAEQVRNMVLSARPEDFHYNDDTGVYLHMQDVDLQIITDRSDRADEEFHEAWVTNFPDPHGRRQEVYIHYRGSRVATVPCVSVDGGRYLVPFPKSARDLTIDGFQYHVARILNHPFPGHGLDYALQVARITVQN
jgi:hypothetical protein